MAHLAPRACQQLYSTTHVLPFEAPGIYKKNCFGIRFEGRTASSRRGVCNSVYRAFLGWLGNSDGHKVNTGNDKKQQSKPEELWSKAPCCQTTPLVSNRCQDLGRRNKGPKRNKVRDSTPEAGVHTLCVTRCPHGDVYGKTYPWVNTQHRDEQAFVLFACEALFALVDCLFTSHGQPRPAPPPPTSVHRSPGQPHTSSRRHSTHGPRPIRAEGPSRCRKGHLYKDLRQLVAAKRLCFSGGSCSLRQSGCCLGRRLLPLGGRLPALEAQLRVRQLTEQVCAHFLWGVGVAGGTHTASAAGLRS